MTNHPNRNWRRRMQQAADQWLTVDRIIYVPLSHDEFRARLREAYLAGYQDGRRSTHETI